jgi:hypothetical protein
MYNSNNNNNNNNNNNGKRQSFPCDFLTKNHTMKVYWGEEVYLYSFFDLCTRGE